MSEHTTASDSHSCRTIPKCFDEDRLSDKLVTLCNDPVKRWLFDTLSLAQPFAGCTNERGADSIDIAYLPDTLFAHFELWASGKQSVNRYCVRNGHVLMQQLQQVLPVLALEPEGGARAVTAEDVACWNMINGYSGCNTPWPSN